MSRKSYSPSAPPPYSVVDPYLPYTNHRASTPPHSGNTASAEVPNPGENKTSTSDTAYTHGRYSSLGSNTSPLPPKTSGPVPSPTENTTSVTYTPHPQAPASAFHPYTPSPASTYQHYTTPASALLSYSYPHTAAAQYAAPYPYGYTAPSAYSPYTTAPTVIVALPNQTPPAAYAPYQVPGVMMQGEGTVAAPDQSFNDESATSSCKVHGSDYVPHQHPLHGHHPLLGYHYHHQLGQHHHHNPGNQ
ncbi:uncharacterized protein LOC135112577 [Scylla paramamosain]|uniref:uncharacterized protein LOC135112577 n=1 Tax=Scylla paramamosain TaxID=85552 RepID=UPI0030839146